MEEDAEPFDEKMARLMKDLEAQFAESASLEKAIRENMKGLGYGKQNAANGERRKTT